MPSWGTDNPMSAFLRCSNSFVRSSGMLNTTLALWARVLYTLFLAVMKGLLSKCRYWTVCVLDSCRLWWECCCLVPCVTFVSRNGMEPSDPGSCTVNCMLGSCELMCCRSCWLCSVFWMTRVSSTNLSQRLGVEGRLEGFGFKLFHEQVGYEGASGGTHGCSMRPVYSTYLGRGSRRFWGKTPGVWQFGEWTIGSFWGVLGPVWVFVEQRWLQGLLALKWIGPWHHMKKWPPLIAVWHVVFFLWSVGCFWDDVEIVPPVDIWYLPAP